MARIWLVNTAITAVALTVAGAASANLAPGPSQFARDTGARVTRGAPIDEPPLISVPKLKNAAITTTPGRQTKLKVKVTDRAGQPIAGMSVIFVAPETGPGGTFAGADPSNATFVRSTTNAKGVASARFITNAESGVFLVEAFVEPSEGDIRVASTTFAVSNGIGPAPPLDARVARTAIEQQLLGGLPLDETLELHGPVLLPAGATFIAAGPTVSAQEPEPFDVDRLSWFFWIDENPPAEFGHSTRFVTLDATDTTPDVASEAFVTRELWWPAIAVEPGGQAHGLLPPGRINSSIVSSVPAAGVMDRALESRMPVENACAVVAHGGPEFRKRLEANRAAFFFQSIQQISPDDIFVKREGLLGLPAATTRTELEQFLRQAQERHCDKFFLYLNGHGFPAGSTSPGGFCLANESDSDGSTEHDFLTYPELATLLEPFGRDGTEVCVAIAACFSGAAVAALQGHGYSGAIVTSADSLSLSAAFHGLGSAFSLAFLSDAFTFTDESDTNGDGHVDFIEAGNYVQANTGFLTDGQFTNPNVQASTIQAVAARITAEHIVIPFIGGTASIAVKRPQGETGRLMVEIRMIADPPKSDIAVFSASGSIRARFEIGPEAQLAISPPLTAVLNGVQPYEIVVRNLATGAQYVAVAGVQVGSGYSVTPNPLGLLVGGEGTATLTRTGVISYVQRPLVLMVAATDPTIVSVPATVEFDRRQLQIPIPVTGLAEGSTTVTLTDVFHGVTFSFQVIVTAKKVAHVTNSSNSGMGSLALAISTINNDSGFGNVFFSIPTDDPGFDPSTGVLTITPTTPLPAVLNPVLIDGSTQPGFVDTPLIQIDGNSVNTPNADGLVILAGDCIVNAIAITRFPGNGIELCGPLGGNVIDNTLIGTDTVGGTGLGNDQHGILIDGSPMNQILNSTISGNGGSGIFLNQSGATNNIVMHNNIGVDRLGTIRIGNDGEGATLIDSPGNRLEDNVISGNGDGSSAIGAGAGNNVYQGNFVGTDRTGLLNLGNQGAGYGFANGASGNRYIDNRIAFNRFGIIGIAGTGNKFDRNAIYSNTDVGIDLGLNGVTGNDSSDADAGPNGLQNFPDLSDATTTGSLLVRGQLNSAMNTTFTLQFFASPTLDGTGFGEGQTFVGSFDVQTDGSGVVTFAATFPTTVPAGQFVTATACDQAGNTSEFSRGVAITQRLHGSPPLPRRHHRKK